MTSQPVEQRGDFKEWNYTETHLPVRRVDEHNACVTALRAALAERDQFKAGFEAATKTIEINSPQWADAARLREAVLRQEAWTAEQQRDREELAKDAALADAARLREALVQAEACMSIVEPRSDKAEYLRILGVARAALGQEESPK